MSVVLAVKDGDRILMAGDSQVSRGSVKMTLNSFNSMKVFKVNGHEGMVMGVAGSYRDSNILSTMDSLYDPILDKAHEEIDFKFVVRNVVPALINELNEWGRVSNDADAGYTSKSTILLAKDDKCYNIDYDFSVSELCYDGEAMAIGSGADISLAVYNALADIEGMDIKEKLIRAVSQACQDDLYVNFPIIIHDTTSDDIEVFDGVDLYSLANLEEEDLEKLEQEIKKEEESDEEDAK